MPPLPVPEMPTASMPYGVQTPAERAETSRQIRVKAAEFERAQPLPAHNDNGDEELYEHKHGSYSKGLAHNQFGVVEAGPYRALHRAVSTGVPQHFQNIPLGGTVKFVNPQGGLAFDLEGADSHALAMPPSPAVASAERAGEMVELYWMALCRDVPFTDYGTNPLTLGAIADLNNLSVFKGPKEGPVGSQKVTPQTLFRGDTPGEKVGPYISQFFMQSAGFGDLASLYDVDRIQGQQYYAYEPGLNYMVDKDLWLKVQNGQGTAISPNAPFGPNKYITTGVGPIKDACNNIVTPDGEKVPFYLFTGRMGSAFVHVDELYQAYFMAALNLLDSLKFNSYDVNNPYQVPAPGSATEAGFGTFGNPHVATLVAEVATRALKAQWYQKWFVHRALRPEAYGGMVNFKKSGTPGAPDFPVHPDVLNSSALPLIHALPDKSKPGSPPAHTYFLPMAFPEGSPQHPSYGSGHATVAGACATIIKAFFNEDLPIDCPVQADPTGKKLVKYVAPPGEPPLTLGGEANKIAGNVGMFRNHAGVHWRSDHVQSILLGEKIAISILQDQRWLYNEEFKCWSFTTFDGTKVTI